MKNIYIPATENTPEVNLSVENCRFEIKGASYTDNIFEDIYSIILKWIEEEMPNVNCEINCVFSISILNSISYKNIMQILMKFTEYRKSGQNIKITWYFEGDDEDNEELAHDLSLIFDIPFTIHAI